MAIYVDAIINAGIDTGKVQLSSNTSSNERFDIIEYSPVEYRQDQYAHTITNFHL